MYTLVVVRAGQTEEAIFYKEATTAVNSIPKSRAETLVCRYIHDPIDYMDYRQSIRSQLRDQETIHFPSLRD